MTDIQKRFRELYKYNPSKGIIKEGYGDVDTSNYICIGEVPYSPWFNGPNRLYIMVSPQKIMEYGEEQYDVRYTENSDGSGRQIQGIPIYVKRNAVIYPEHQNDEYGEIFLGKRKDKDLLIQQHKEFESKLFKYGENIILHHDSSFKVNDGFIKKGKPNWYSNNTDIGIYFWGSRTGGKDISNGGWYTYYCLIKKGDLYDLDTNEERLSLDQAIKKYPYVGQHWKNDDNVIVVNTYLPTPIWCILDKQTGKWYNKEWKEIEKPFN